jgi:hypothetical protein
MLKKIGIPLLALAGMMVLIPTPKASAAVRFGVVVGGGPRYAYPVYPAYPDAYAPDYYNGYPAYSYPAPTYDYPYNSYRGHEGHEYMEHRREWRGRENYRGREDYRGHEGSRGREGDDGRGR